MAFVKVSAEELFDSCLAQFAAVNAALNSVVEVARAALSVLDEGVRNGGPLPHPGGAWDHYL